MPTVYGGLHAATAYYAWLDDTLMALSLMLEAETWRAAFAAAFPPTNLRDAVSAMKQFDVLIWAGAER